MNSTLNNMSCQSPMTVVKNFVNDMNLFLFATGLRKENENLLYDTILYAKVHDNYYDDRSSSIPSFGILTEKIQSSENLIKIVENLYDPPRPISNQTFGVLGKEQLDFFRNTFSNSIDDVLGFFISMFESDIITERWNDKKHISYIARRIEMFQNLLKERIAITAEFPIIGTSSIFKELLISEKQRIIFEEEMICIPQKIIQYDKDFCDKILNINVLVYANELTKSIANDPSSNIIFEFNSVVLVPMQQTQFTTREFVNVIEFLHFFIYLFDHSFFNIAVLGNDQCEFFKYVVDETIGNEQTRKVIDVLGHIPKEIDYVCQNADHANYHAKRIESYREYFKYKSKKIPEALRNEWRFDANTFNT